MAVGLQRKPVDVSDAHSDGARLTRNRRRSLLRNTDSGSEGFAPTDAMFESSPVRARDSDSAFSEQENTDDNLLTTSAGSSQSQKSTASGRPSVRFNIKSKGSGDTFSYKTVSSRRSSSSARNSQKSSSSERKGRSRSPAVKSAKKDESSSSKSTASKKPVEKSPASRSASSAAVSKSSPLRKSPAKKPTSKPAETTVSSVKETEEPATTASIASKNSSTMNSLTQGTVSPPTDPLFHFHQAHSNQQQQQRVSPVNYQQEATFSAQHRPAQETVNSYAPNSFASESMRGFANNGSNNQPLMQHTHQPNSYYSNAGMYQSYNMGPHGNQQQHQQHHQPQQTANAALSSAFDNGMMSPVLSNVQRYNSMPYGSNAAYSMQGGNTNNSNSTYSMQGNHSAVPVKSPSMTVEPAAAMCAVENQRQIIEELRSNFQQLNVLRTTDAEQALQDYKKAAEQRFAAADELIEALRKERDQLLEDMVTSNDRTSSAESLPRDSIASSSAHRLSTYSSASSKRLSDAYSEISTISQSFSSATIVELHQNMSGLQILPSSVQENTWNCTLAGRLGEFTFDLALVRSEDFEENEHDASGGAMQYVYTPTFAISSQIAHRLPAYLLEEIAFDADQLQPFFWRALNFLMSSSSSSSK